MANLIGFDKNRENLEFKGHCKLSINFMSNYLYVEPENEAFKLISSSFEWNYVMKKNLLFVFAEFDFLDFCLGFKNEQICKKIFDYIISFKKNDIKKVSVDDSFIVPIFQAIAEKPTSNSHLIETIAKWRQLLDKNEKEAYSKLMKEYGIFEVVGDAFRPCKMQGKQHQFENRKRKFVQIKKEDTPENETEKRISTKKVCYSKIIAAPQFQFMYSPGSPNRKLIIFSVDEKGMYYEYKSKPQENKFRCINCEHQAVTDVDENGKICVKVEERMHSCLLSKKFAEKYKKSKIMRKPDYQFFENSARNSDKVLVIHDCIDKSLCYEFCWSKQELKFCCRGCSNVNNQSKKGHAARARCFNEGTEKEYIEIVNDHVCEKRTFQPEKFRQHFDYVLKPYFEIQKFHFKEKERQRLLIFDSKDRNKFYKYYTVHKVFRCQGCVEKGKYVFAKLRQNSDAEEYIILSHAKHICELKTTTCNKIDLYPPQFKLLETTKMGTKKVFVFDERDRKKCYVFSHTSNGYYCRGCATTRSHNRNKVNAGKIVTGKLIKNEGTGGYTFQMKPNQTHSCEPRPYQPEQYEVQILPKTYDFFFYRQKSRPNMLKLGIIHPENKIMCFEFTFVNASTRFQCNKCNTKKNRIFIYLKSQKDANGKEYFHHDWKKHVCQPIKVSTISPPNFVILKESGIEAKPKAKPKSKIDKTKIVRKPDYELLPNKAGDPDKKLIIFKADDKSLCYEYCFHKHSQLFKCNKCGTAKKCVNAKLHKSEVENGDEFLVLGKNDHICEPTKVSASKFATLKKREPNEKTNHVINEDKIVRQPNFKLCPNSQGIADKKLVILHPTDKSSCYEFRFKRNQTFICNKCSSMKNYVSIKLCKDEKNNDMFVELGTKEHVCQPVKYQPMLRQKSK